MRTRGATLIGAEAPSSSPRASDADGPLPITVEIPVTPSWASGPFGSRLTDPFRARSPPGLHHSPARWDDRGRAYSFRSQPL